MHIRAHHSLNGYIESINMRAPISFRRQMTSAEWYELLIILYNNVVQFRAICWEASPCSWRSHRHLIKNACSYPCFLASRAVIYYREIYGMYAARSMSCTDTAGMFSMYIGFIYGTVLRISTVTMAGSWIVRAHGVMEGSRHIGVMDVDFSSDECLKAF